MKLAIAFLAILSLTACDYFSRSKTEMKEGGKEGMQSKKKVEQALKQGEAARREAVEK